MKPVLLCMVIVCVVSVGLSSPLHNKDQNEVNIQGNEEVAAADHIRQKRSPRKIVSIEEDDHSDEIVVQKRRSFGGGYESDSSESESEERPRHHHHYHGYGRKNLHLRGRTAAAAAEAEDTDKARYLVNVGAPYPAYPGVAPVPYGTYGSLYAHPGVVYGK